MEGENSTQIVEHLKSISKMLAYLIIQDLETIKDKIIRLHKVGLSSIIISEYLGKTRNYVDSTISKARKSDEV